MRTASSPFLVMTGAASDLGASATSQRLTCSSSARRSGGAPFSPPLTAHSQEMKEEKTPMGLVAWAREGFAPLPDLYHGGG
jgi:hypothetical protein